MSAKDMKVERLRDTEDHITKEAVEKSSTVVVEAGTVLLVVRSGILKHTLPVTVTERPAAINQDLKALSVRADILPEYIAWAFRAFSREILHTCSKAGTTVQSIVFSRLKEFQIPVAPLPEQRRIVEAIEEHFSRLDVALRNVGAARKRIQGLESTLLAETIDPSWPEVAIGEIVDEALIGLDRARRFQTPEGPGVGYIRMNHLGSDGEVTLTGLTYVTISDSELAKYAVRPGDLLFNTRNSVELVGKVGLVREVPTSGLVYNNNLMRIRTRQDINTEFLLTVMRSPWFRRKLDSVKSATTNVAAIYAKNLLSLTVPLPSLGAQRAVVEDVRRHTSICSHTKALVDLTNERGRSLRSALLREAFAGRLVPHDSANEWECGRLQKVTP